MSERAEQLPALPLAALQRHIEYRQAMILERILLRWYQGNLSEQDVYGTLGAMAALKEFLQDEQRRQRPPQAKE